MHYMDQRTIPFQRFKGFCQKLAEEVQESFVRGEHFKHSQVNSEGESIIVYKISSRKSRLSFLSQTRAYITVYNTYEQETRQHTVHKIFINLIGNADAHKKVDSKKLDAIRDRCEHILNNPRGDFKVEWSTTQSAYNHWRRAKDYEFNKDLKLKVA